MKSNPKQMRQYRFLLNVAKSEEQELSEIIRDLKSKRSFTRAIRTGLRLFWSLMNGRTDILVAEFPWVVEQLQSPFGNLQEQLNRIETKLAHTPVVLEKAEIERVLPSPRVADERLNLTVNQAQIFENPTFNILISVASIDAIGFIGLDLEVLEYGIKQGKIPPHFLELKKARIAERQGDTAPTIPILASDAKPLVGADQDLSAPEWDDLEDLNW